MGTDRAKVPNMERPRNTLLGNVIEMMMTALVLVVVIEVVFVGHVSLQKMRVP